MGADTAGVEGQGADQEDQQDQSAGVAAIVDIPGYLSDGQRAVRGGGGATVASVVVGKAVAAVAAGVPGVKGIAHLPAQAAVTTGQRLRWLRQPPFHRRIPDFQCDRDGVTFRVIDLYAVGIPGTGLGQAWPGQQRWLVDNQAK